MDEANAHYKLGSCFLALGDCDEAMRHYFQVLRIARRLNSENFEARCYLGLAKCFSRRGDHQRAVEQLEKSLRIGERIGDEETEYKALAYLGYCYQYLGQCDKAIDYHEKALILVKKTGNKANEERLFSSLSLATCYKRLEQFDKAIKTFKVGLTIAEELGRKAVEAGIHLKLADCYESLDDVEKASRAAKMSLDLAKQSGFKRVELEASRVLGLCCQASGQFGKALEYQIEALKIAELSGNKDSEGEVCINIGNTYSHLGQISEAIKYQEMALDIAKQTGDKDKEQSAHGNLGINHELRGETPGKVIYHFEEALKIAQEIRDPGGEQRAHCCLGGIYSSCFEFEKSRQHYEASLEIARRNGDTMGEARSLGMFARYYLELGQYDKAVELLEIALASFVHQTGKRVEEGTTCLELGRAHICLRQYDKADNYLKRCMEFEEEQFGSLTRSDSLKVSFLDTFADTYKFLCAALLAQGKSDEALVIAERGRAKALTGLMLLRNPTVQGGTDIRGAKVLTLSEIRGVVGELGSSVVFFSLVPLMCTWAIKPNGEIILGGNPIKEEESLFVMFALEEGRFAGEIQKLDDLIKKTMESLRSHGTMKCEDRSLSFLYHDEPGMKLRAQAGAAMSSTSTPESAFPRHGTCSQGRASSQYFSFQQMSVPSTSLKVPSTSTQVDPAPEPGPCRDGPSSPPPVPSKGMPTAAVSAENPDEAAVSHPEELDAALKTLYKKTLAPVRHLVEGSQVVIVPDGPLALLPFAALVDEQGRYVAESLQVRLLPSLMTAKMIAQYPQEKGNPTTALIVGDPKVGELEVDSGGRVSVSRLPYANEEVRMIGKLLKAEPLTAERATKRAFLQKVDGANLIHIATHGDATTGEILLAPDPELRRDIKLEDVMLTTADLDQRRLKAQLVVLSSCHSARGEVRADGVIGIARAFLGAGARAVLVTLWAVDDEATLFFMRKFYEKLVGGKSASNSLHKAMKAMRESENFNSPCYWAAFVLIGEDVTLFIV